MKRLGIAATAAAVITIATVSGCANTEPATAPAFIVNDTSTSTTTTTTTVDLGWINTTTTTTTTVVPDPVPAAAPSAPVDGCFVDLARSIGWPEETLGTLARIIRRESNCDPSAFADRPSTLDNSRGLLQINAWGTLAGNIRAKCGVEPDALFDPATNLACGLVYWRSMGWRPWGGA